MWMEEDNEELATAEGANNITDDNDNINTVVTAAVAPAASAHIAESGDGVVLDDGDTKDDLVSSIDKIKSNSVKDLLVILQKEIDAKAQLEEMLLQVKLNYLETNRYLF